MEYLADLDHDVYHLPGYVAADDLVRETRTQLFAVSHGGKRLVVPLTLRAVPNESELQDATSPYGYPAPIYTADAEDTWIQDAVAHLVQYLREINVVSVFLRLHPVRGIHSSKFSRYGTQVDHGSTVSVQLGRPFEAIRADMRKSHRYEIRRALREGQQPYLDERWDYFEDFLRIYTATMDRLGASKSYYFSREYFTHFRDELAEHISLWVTKINGEIAAASIITECNGVVQYHLSGTHPDYHRQYPTKVLLDEVANWANERGNSRFHLGGGLGGNEDSLFQFKAGFSKERHEYSTVRIITLTEDYNRLAKNWEITAGLPSDGPTAFFPSYRKPY